ncbi:MAG: fatty-acyl-CoA synthase [Acidimicrobiaceae bacterium]|jgi:fatty-acyl-CoA synthase
MTAAPATVVERLRAAATNGGGRVVFHSGEVRPFEVPEMYDLARIRGGRLAVLGVGPGTRVGVLGPNAPDFVGWAYGTWLLGATLVPIPVPLRVRDPGAVSTQLTATAASLGCSVVAAHERFAPLLPPDVAVGWDDHGSADDALGESDFVEGRDDDYSFIQPTSGTTAAPKGVGWTYGGMKHADFLQSVNPFNAPEVRCLINSPFGHAGGVIGFYGMMFPGLEVHLLSPERFVRDPGEFFRIIGRHDVTMTIGASSAMAAAVRAIERETNGIDFSSLVWFPFCYEMVDPAVVDRVNAIGGRHGLRPGVIGAMYGMSEGGGTRTEPGEGMRIEDVDLDVLVATGVAQPPGAGATVKRVASCGAPYRLELRIASEGGALPDRHVGEVQFRGAALMTGYVGLGGEDVFDANGWMRTGDVGFIAEGELFITGRVKEVIVQQGRKYHPEDIEWAAAQGADVAPGECVAFTPVGAAEGDIVIVVETSSTDALSEIEQRVRAAVINRVGIVPRTVIFVAPESLPKTASGKAQRVEARDRYARGELATNR